MNSRSRAAVSSILLVALFLPPTVGSSGQKDQRTVRTTAYTHTESDHLKYGRKTAIGTRLRNTRSYTSAAADWSRYPVGTTFRIKGSSTNYVIDDYGSALVGTGTIDLYHPSKSSMNRWGARHVEIEITKWGDYEKSRQILAQRTKYRHCRQMLAAIPDASSQPKKNYWWSRKPKDKTPAPDPAPTPKPEPQAPVMLADAKETPKRGWPWNRKSADSKPAPAKPEPTPEPKRSVEPQRSPILLAANTPQPTKSTAPAPAKPEPKPAPRPQPQAKPAAPTPAPTPATAPAEAATVQLASATKPTPKPQATPAPAPPAPAELPAPPVTLAANTPPAQPPLPPAAVPRVRKVTPISAAPRSVAAPTPAATADEPVAMQRRPGTAAVPVAAAQAPDHAIFAVARPDSPVPQRKRQFRALPTHWQPTAIN